MLLDASGKPPMPVTAFERRVAERTESGALSRALTALQEKQNLPLTEKVKITLELIRDWYESWDGMVSISYSGGKDSEVLKHLVRSILHRYVMNKLGLGKVLQYCREAAPARLAKKFRCGCD